MRFAYADPPYLGCAEHGHIVKRDRPRCQATDNFYGCTLDDGHNGDHESRSGCISAHRWQRAPVSEEAT